MAEICMNVPAGRGEESNKQFLQGLSFGDWWFWRSAQGELPDGTVVAIKLAKVGSVKSTQQVLNKVGILSSEVNHKNLVRLLGCCIEGDQPLTIYEYISNGTRHDHLHGKSAFLDWRKRLRVALKTAEALAYLHSGAYTPIQHRDVKSTNILLDNDFNAKIADFGPSRLARPGLGHALTCAQGTLGYLDPENYCNYQLTDKSDVYSYGVVLLELLTSQNAIDFSRHEDDVNLTIYVSQRAKNVAIMEVIDQRSLSKDPLDNILTQVSNISRSSPSRVYGKADRPSMKEAVQQLESIAQTVDQEENL